MQSVGPAVMAEMLDKPCRWDLTLLSEYGTPSFIAWFVNLRISATSSAVADG